MPLDQRLGSADRRGQALRAGEEQPQHERPGASRANPRPYDRPLFRAGRKVGADAFITGDMVHSPLQMRYPELGMMSDFSSDQAGQTWRVLFTQLSDTPRVVCTGHFPSPSVGLPDGTMGSGSSRTEGHQGREGTFGLADAAFEG